MVSCDAARLHERYDDAADISEAIGGEAQGQFEGFGDGSRSLVQAGREGDLCEKVDETLNGDPLVRTV